MSIKETIYNQQPWQTYDVELTVKVRYRVEGRARGAAQVEAAKQLVKWERPDDIIYIWPEDAVLVRDKMEPRG